MVSDRPLERFALVAAAKQTEQKIKCFRHIKVVHSTIQNICQNPNGRI